MTANCRSSRFGDSQMDDDMERNLQRMIEEYGAGTEMAMLRAVYDEMLLIEFLGWVPDDGFTI